MGITSVDLVGKWNVLYVSGTEHPMVGGVIELTEDHKLISYDRSGKKGAGSANHYWYVLRMETGESLIAVENDFSTTQEFNPVLDQFEMTMIVILDGDEMRWNLLTRNGHDPVSPSEELAYRFKRQTDE